MEIGLVGGGASAVCLLDALAEESGLPAGRITVFEPSPNLWRGRAYQPDIDTVRVNAPPWDMSVRAGDDDHFGRWLTSRDLVIGPAGYWDTRSGMRFVPRAIYGDYLEQSARAALQVLRRRGWGFDVIRDRVEDATTTSDGILLVTRQGVTRQVDRVVLCFGSGPPADIYSLRGNAGFVHDPYPFMDWLAGNRPDQDISVIGGGLTAIDVVLALADRGHRGSIQLGRRRVDHAHRARPRDGRGARHGGRIPGHDSR